MWRRPHRGTRSVLCHSTPAGAGRRRCCHLYPPSTPSCLLACPAVTCVHCTLHSWDSGTMWSFWLLHSFSHLLLSLCDYCFQQCTELCCHQGYMLRGCHPCSYAQLTTCLSTPWLLKLFGFREESTKGRMSPEPQLTGMAKTFNSVTFTGRANVAKATYAGEPMCKCYNVKSALSFCPETKWCTEKYEMKYFQVLSWLLLQSRRKTTSRLSRTVSPKISIV